MARRLRGTVSPDVGSLLDWYAKHDPRFKGYEATAAAHFLEMGLRGAYEQGLAEADTLDADEFAVLADQQRAALSSVE